MVNVVKKCLKCKKAIVEGKDKFSVISIVNADGSQVADFFHFGCWKQHIEDMMKLRYKNYGKIEGHLKHFNSLGDKVLGLMKGAKFDVRGFGGKKKS